VDRKKIKNKENECRESEGSGTIVPAKFRKGERKEQRGFQDLRDSSTALKNTRKCGGGKGMKEG